ncbi:hypothetical protein [Streptomyces decoyicus]|uniref:hypothetical protein n=1 Tax=Streptomyces decoyicus TaxID=249567 RepID=UPI00339F0B84
MRIANLNAYKLKLDARGSAAWQARVTAIHEIGPHILGLQEVVVDESATAKEEWDESAAETIKAFAADCGLTASVEATPRYPYGAAMAANSHRPWYTALLWDPNAAEVVPDSYRPYGAPDFWHGFTTARLGPVGHPSFLYVCQVMPPDVAPAPGPAYKTPCGIRDGGQGPEAPNGRPPRT